MKRLLITASFLLLATGLFTTSASAQTVSLSGFAWSDLPNSNTEVGAGWISFSGPGPYGVVADISTGNLSGEAWSSNYGWLSFNSTDVSGCPSAPCQPNVNPSTGVVTGWARFIAAPAGTTGVWNGWVHLSSGSNPVIYSSTTRTFSGYAWGQNDIGWIKFSGTASNGSPYAVTMDPLTPPEAVINIVVVPASASWTINPGSIVGTGNGTATVTPAQTGTSYTVTGGSAPSGYDPIPVITNSQPGGSVALILPGTSITFTITYAQSFNYTLSNSGNVTIPLAGMDQYGNNIITVTQTGGASQAVTLSHSNLPAGVSPGGFSGGGCTPSTGNPCTSTATLRVSPSAVPGTYTGITVTGLPLGRTTTYSLTITPPAGIVCNVTGTPVISGESNVGDDITWAVNVTSDDSPLPHSYTYSWSGSAVPDEQTIIATADQSFVMSYSTTGSKSVTATVYNQLNNQQQCTGNINIGVKPGFSEF